ncbi:NACHT domain-containing protein [Pseudofrankia saprophytica]|uniref:NACHT domain-containing protein n=1 Tax=Pseudofrankia saprophytica TaxID=298655 RepID=UPI0018E381F4|nr:NACHT domain-containing protein [Pseudofrankia saprophytica]
MASSVSGTSKDSMRRVVGSGKLEPLARVLEFVKALDGDESYWTNRWNQTNAALLRERRPAARNPGPPPAGATATPSPSTSSPATPSPPGPGTPRPAMSSAANSDLASGPVAHPSSATPPEAMSTPSPATPSPAEPNAPPSAVYGTPNSRSTTDPSAQPSPVSAPSSPVLFTPSPVETHAPTWKPATPDQTPGPDPRPGGPPTPSPPWVEPSSEAREVADKLARTVLGQWTKELDLRRIWDPAPLPVSWMEAPPDLVERWEHIDSALRQLRTEGARGERLAAVAPPWLAGGDTQIADIFNTLPTRRLVVLGDPGSGKSILLGRLVVDLLRERRPGGAVPVIVSAASWNPTAQDLWPWLTGRLVAAYPGLGRPMPGQHFVRRSHRVREVDALREANLLVPVLDGLDEIPGRVQAQAIAKINEALPPEDGIVVSCRVSEFRSALRAAPKLRNAFGITLRDLEPDAVRNYLEHDAGDDRWDPIIPVLGGSSPVAQVLRVPLYVSLARTIYNPHSGNLGAGAAGRPTGVGRSPGEAPRGGLPDPEELLDEERFQTPDKVKDHLFRAFIPAAYRRTTPSPGPRGPTPAGRWSRRIGGPGRYTAEQAERWLTYLARHLKRNADNVTDLDWWDIRRAVPRPLAGAVVGAICGLATGLVALTDPRLGVGLGVGMLTALAVALPVRFLADRRRSEAAGSHPNGRIPLRKDRTLASSLVCGVVGGLAGGVLGGAASMVGIGTASGLLSATAGALAVGLGIGASGGRLGGALGATAGGCATALTAGVGQGVLPAIIDGLAIALGAGFAVGVGGADEPAEKLRWSSAGLVGGLAIGAGVGVGAVLGLGASLFNGLIAGLTAGVAAGLATGMRGAAPTDLTLAAGPRTLYARDRKTFAVVTTIFGVTMVFGTYVPEGYNVSLGAAFAGALTIGLTGGFLHACWGTFAIARAWLAIRGELPWDLMGFLTDAHEQRGVLRQAGAHYQYRHAEPQRHLAERADH